MRLKVKQLGLVFFVIGFIAVVIVLQGVNFINPFPRSSPQRFFVDERRGSDIRGKYNKLRYVMSGSGKSNILPSMSLLVSAQKR